MRATGRVYPGDARRRHCSVAVLVPLVAGVTRRCAAEGALNQVVGAQITEGDVAVLVLWPRSVPRWPLFHDRDPPQPRIDVELAGSPFD